MFAMGTLQARERGIEHNLLTHWVGRNQQENWMAENTQLSLGQIVLVFVCLPVFFSSSFAILGLEMAYVFIKSRWARLMREREKEMSVGPKSMYGYVS
jgi:hypothetical protein